jgi:cysteine synthase B
MMARVVETITDLIGNTPLLKVPAHVHGLKNISLYAKLEYFNPFGSVKDRVAWQILKDELPQLQKSTRTVIENSSGNTAKAVAALAGMWGVPFRLVSAMAKVEETKDMLRLMGVQIQEVPNAVDCFDPNDPNDPNFIIEREVAESKGKLFFTGQFFNAKNPQAHYDTTGAELLDALPRIDFLCAGLGTSGSTLGIARRIRERDKGLISVGITSGSNDFIPGIRTINQLKEYGFFDPAAYNSLVTVESSQALDGMLTLIRSCGMLCGPSAGANYSGAVSYLREVDASLSQPATAVFIACDRTEWYLSYIRQRRSEVFGGKERKDLLTSLSEASIAASPVLPLQGAVEWISSHNALVVDIRNPLAFEIGTIPDAINIPLEALEPLVQSRVPFCGPDRSVLFVCPIGEQSKRFAAQLTRLGAKAFSLEGGLQAWRSRGYPLSSDQDLLPPRRSPFPSAPQLSKCRH